MMSKRMTASHTGRLILTPAKAWDCPETGPLVAALSESGLIGAPIHGLVHAFRVGPAFLELVAFTGCAVAITSDPLVGRAFCHLQMPPASPEPRLHQGRNTRPPRCPGCRGRLPDWSTRLAGWADDPHADLICPTCGAAHPPWRWDWKQQGGLGRRLILIEEIFPGEAVPTPALLGILEQASGAGWRYFYVQD